MKMKMVWILDEAKAEREREREMINLSRELKVLYMGMCIFFIIKVFFKDRLN